MATGDKKGTDDVQDTPQSGKKNKPEKPKKPEPIDGDAYLKSVSFPEPLERGQTDVETRLTYYQACLTAGQSILKVYFANANDISGTGISNLPADHQYREQFKPRGFKKPQAYTRMWEAVQLASQNAFLKENLTPKELEELSILEQWKLIVLPNDNIKLNKVYDILKLTADDRAKRGKIASIVDEWKPRDLIKAVTRIIDANDPTYKHLQDVNRMITVIKGANEDEAKDLATALDEVSREVKRLLTTLNFLREMV
jgi:hypothetical protein